MARAVAADVVRTSRASTPESIDADLAALWRDLAGAESPLARAVMSNLVVFRALMNVDPAGVDVATQALPIDEVAARHPSRLIVLEHQLGREEPAAPFAAAVSVLAFGPVHARYGVEEIVVRSACVEASLPSIVRRLIRGDVPTTVWWTEDVAARPPLDSLVTIGRQLIYDSRDWRDVRAGIAALAPLVSEHRIDLADVNWRRLTPLRRAFIHVAGTDSPAEFFRGAQLRIAHRPEDAALAWLLAGWILTLGDSKATASPPDVVESTSGDAVLAVTLRRGNVETTATLTGRSVEIAQSDSAARPLVVGIPVESDAEAIAAELRTLAHDATLHGAIAALARLFAAA